MQGKFNIEIFPNPENTARRCLDLFLEKTQEHLDRKNIFYFAISGGNTPKRFFELLSESKRANTLRWNKIHLFWVDERYVALDSPLSNFGLAYDTFLTKVPVETENVYRILTEYSNMKAAAREYEITIRSLFIPAENQLPQFDLIFLGLGPDGHIASLFPSSKALLETKKLVTFVDDVNPARITLTAPVLCAASNIILQITGEEKSKILKEVLTNEPNPQKYPVHLLWPVLDKVTWVVDSAAAKLI